MTALIFDAIIDRGLIPLPLDLNLQPEQLDAYQLQYLFALSKEEISKQLAENGCDINKLRREVNGESSDGDDDFEEDGNDDEEVDDLYDDGENEENTAFGECGQKIKGKIITDPAKMWLKSEVSLLNMM